MRGAGQAVRADESRPGEGGEACAKHGSENRSASSRYRRAVATSPAMPSRSGARPRLQRRIASGRLGGTTVAAALFRRHAPALLGRAARLCRSTGSGRDRFAAMAQADARDGGALAVALQVEVGLHVFALVPGLRLLMVIDLHRRSSVDREMRQGAMLKGELLTEGFPALVPPGNLLVIPLWQ